MIAPGTALKTDADIDDFWTQAMGPLGFAYRRLWVAFLDGENRLLPALPTLDGVPETIDPDIAAQLMSTFGQVVPSDGAVILLLSRPGGPMNRGDRAFAAMLHASADRAGVPLRTIHLATDVHLRQFAPDDLVNAA